MLQIYQSTERTAKKFVGFNLCFILMFITFCNIFTFTCFADEVKETPSATEILTNYTEKSTESITELVTEKVTEFTEATDEATEILYSEDISEVFYYRFIVVLLIIILFLIIVNKLF